jgi:hypothetical protein
MRTLSVSCRLKAYGLHRAMNQRYAQKLSIRYVSGPRNHYRITRRGDYPAPSFKTDHSLMIVPACITKCYKQETCPDFERHWKWPGPMASRPNASTFRTSIFWIIACNGEPARASVRVEGGCGRHWDNCWSGCSAGYVLHWTRRQNFPALIGKRYKKGNATRLRYGLSSRESVRTLHWLGRLLTFIFH